MESEAADTAHLHRPLSPARDHGKARPERSSIVPPYWKRNSSSVNGGGSGAANPSVESLVRPPPIQLEDHTDAGSEQCKALWAKRVTVDDYVIVGGTGPGLGSYVVWNCTVETLDGGPMKIMKRYSEFDELRRQLVKTFPHAQGAIPPLPPKSVISKFRPRFLEKRHAGLSYFLNCILLNPEFAGSPVLKDFLFS
ncbi:Phox-like protein [Sporormia fimetaria CBS 119925]|uniref:Endosomal/vacuolar adapter protein YPT35 n=1 Tax=Sporormia fimetaria CBS 119925 TaxID=1340428 RepID=A0A6A6V046_9PLEO|nr:Phox-like protein [Sporormia fimetaria CBS 119925]